MTTPTPADLIRDLTHAIAAMNDVSPDRVRIDVAIDFAGSDEPEDDEVSSQPTSRARSRSADRLGPFTEGSGVQSVWQMFEAKGADAAFFHGLTVPSWKNPDAEGLSPVTLVLWIRSWCRQTGKLDQWRKLRAKLMNDKSLKQRAKLVKSKK